MELSPKQKAGARHASALFAYNALALLTANNKVGT
jgi:hypothetical protein